MPHPPLRRAWPARRTSLAVSGLFLACLATAGCSEPADSDEPAPTTPAASAASADPAAPDAATARQTTRIQGAGGNVDVGFVGLRVDGRLAQLDLLFTPRYADDPGKEISLYEMAGRRDAAVTLVDTTNLLRYTVVKDAGGNALGAAAGTTRTRNDVPVATSFTFAAPPPEVTALDVYLNDRLIADDAPVTR